MKISELKSTLQTICGLYKIGNLKAYRTADHNLKGYKIAFFEVEDSSKVYEYIFKN